MLGCSYAYTLPLKSPVTLSVSRLCAMNLSTYHPWSTHQRRQRCSEGQRPAVTREIPTFITRNSDRTRRTAHPTASVLPSGASVLPSGSVLLSDTRVLLMKLCRSPRRLVLQPSSPILELPLNHHTTYRRLGVLTALSVPDNCASLFPIPRRRRHNFLYATACLNATRHPTCLVRVVHSLFPISVHQCSR